MRISFERSGGFMGRKVNFSTDLDELADDEAIILKHLLDQADFFNLPEKLTSHPIPDEFNYLITVETGIKSHRVRFSETSVTEPLRPLVDNLSSLARARDHKP